MPGDGAVTYPSEMSEALIPYKVVSDTYNYYEVRNYINDVNRTNTQVSGGSYNRSGGGRSAGHYSGGSGSGGSSYYAKTAYERAKSTGKSTYSWGRSKLKEAKNIWKSWTASMEKTVKRFCTTANRIKKSTVKFLKNVDWKKVAIGVGVTVAVAGLVVLSGGSAAPVLIGATIGAGSGAVISGGIAAIRGGSITEVARAASDGFMWGAIGGSFSGGMTAVLSSAVKSGSKAAASVVVQKGLDIASDTVVDIAQNISQGKKITLASAAGSLAFNIVTAGNANGSTKSVTNSIADSTEDSVRRKAKDSLGNSVSRSGRWDMTGGGGVINGREYSQHAMERMAPDIPQVRAELSRRAEKIAEQRGYKVGTKNYNDFCVKYVDPRNIPPSVIEDAIASTKAVAGNRANTFIHETADVKIIINSSGKVVTVISK